MGAILKLVDAALFIFFLIIAISAPLLDSQSCFPPTLFPNVLSDFHSWYAREYGDYLMAEKPNFFVGLVWLEIFFQWPLALLNLYGILTAKPWFNTTCLISGVSVLSSMAATLGELVGSGKASDTLLKIYFPFLGLGILAMLRGLMPRPSKTTAIGVRPTIGRKKKA